MPNNLLRVWMGKGARLSVLIIPFILLSVLLSSGTGFARAEPRSSEVSFFIGGLIFEERGLDDAAVYGGRYTYNLTGRYALQIASGFSFSSFSGRVSGGSRVVEGKDATVFLYHGDFIYKFRLADNTFSFTTMGVGGMTTDVEGSDPETELMFNFGGGLKILLGGKLAVSLGIRDFVSSIDIGGFLPSAGRIFVSPSRTKSTLEISGSVIFLL